MRPLRPRPYGAHTERRQPAVERTHRGYETDWGPRIPPKTREYLDDLEIPYEETPSVLEERGESFSTQQDRLDVRADSVTRLRGICCGKAVAAQTPVTATAIAIRPPAT